MTKKYSTKKALVASLLSLVLCFSMLIGTTFAWFTDSVTSANNIIKSGNLDIEMYWAEGTEDPDNVSWTDASTGAIFNYDNWEPGYVEVRHIKIANEGTLALKYKVQIVANGEVSDLADVIDVYYVDPAIQVADRAALANAPKLGTLTEVLAGLGESGNGTLEADTADTITIALKMQESAGNEYQNKSIGTSFSIQLLATQLTSESDSFDNQYDADAKYPGVATVTIPENNTEDVVLVAKNIKVTVPASAAAAGDVYKTVVTGETVTTDTETGETTVAFDLTMYKNDVKVDGDTIYEIKQTLPAFMNITEVTHNGVAMTKASTGADQTYKYDSATGVLTIYTTSFSPFEITYTKYKDYTFGKNFFYGGYIGAATGGDFLPIVAVNPQITQYSVFDGDTRITDAVTFRFSDVKKDTIDENSYKVSLNLAILDSDGNDLELKPGMPSTINGKEYLNVYMNLLELPEGYSVSEVKVNGKSFTLTQNASGNPATGEYWIGSDGNDVYLQSMEAGLIEVIVAKTN